jgi:hypothetical protein
MFHFCLTDRRNFGDVMSSETLSRLALRTSPQLDGILQHAPSGHTAVAVWSQKPQDTGQLPNLLICPDGTEEDWAAWITTFAARIRPFSAHIRLITYTEAQRITRELRLPRLDRILWSAAGLVLGEVLAASRLPDKALETIPATACASTLSFPIFRAAALYSDFQQWHQLVSNWEFVRQTTRQRGRAIEGSVVARACATIIEAAGLAGASSLLARGDNAVQIACRELIRSPECVPSNLMEVLGFSAIEERMNGSREDRVVAFADFVRSTTAKAGDSEVISFTLGYLASRIAPGTMRHATVLTPIAHRYPTALLWYGFCAGFGSTEGSSIPNSGSRRVGLDLPPSARRVIRDLLRPESIVDTPHCDINFLELVALSRTGGDPLEGLITTTQGTVIVELAPMVWTAINAPSKMIQGEGLTQTSREREILATIGESIELLREAYAVLTGNELPKSKGEQGSLFPPKRKKK